MSFVNLTLKGTRSEAARQALTQCVVQDMKENKLAKYYNTLNSNGTSINAFDTEKEFSLNAQLLIKQGASKMSTHDKEVTVGPYKFTAKFYVFQKPNMKDITINPLAASLGYMVSGLVYIKLTPL